MAKWQPIETAPEGFYDCLVVTNGRVEFARRDEEGFWDPAMGDRGGDHWQNVTHWMPLPDAPTQTNRETPAQIA